MADASRLSRWQSQSTAGEFVGDSTCLRATMTIPLQQFCDDLTSHNLVALDVLAPMRETLKGTPPEEKAKQLARRLIKQKLLTTFQAQQVLSGRAQSLVMGNYRVLDKLGQGGMGMVLKAVHRRMDRIVAIKIVSPKALASPDLLQRFQREVWAAAKLNHPNIVTAYDADEAGGTHFLVMQYVEGTDLSQLVRANEPLSVDQSLTFLIQAARGLKYAHENGLVHLHGKPFADFSHCDGLVVEHCLFSQADNSTNFLVFNAGDEPVFLRDNVGHPRLHWFSTNSASHFVLVRNLLIGGGIFFYSDQKGETATGTGQIAIQRNVFHHPAAAMEFNFKEQDPVVTFQYNTMTPKYSRIAFKNKLPQREVICRS